MASELTYQEACQSIMDFFEEEDFPWDDFRKLGALDVELFKLNRFHWRQTVEKTSPVRAALQRRTIKVAVLIKHERAAVMAALGIVPRHIDPLADAAKSQRRFGRVGHSPEDFCALAMQIATDDGQANSAAYILSEAFRREAAVRLENAMTMLPTLIYIGYRFQQPAAFMATMNQVLRSMERRKPGAPCHADIHRLCLAQLACAYSERMDGERAGTAFEDEGVKRLIDSSHEIPWYRPQLLRGRAVYRALRCTHLSKAQDDLLRCKEFGGEGNYRGIAHITQNIHLKRSTPDFKKAWDVVAPFHKSARDLLEAAMLKGRNDIRDLMHLCPSVFIGAMMRHLAGDGEGRREDLERDVDALNWCYDRYEGLLLYDPDTMDEKHSLPPSLRELRDKCTRKRLTGTERATLDRVAIALKDIPH